MHIALVWKPSAVPYNLRIHIKPLHYPTSNYPQFPNTIASVGSETKRTARSRFRPPVASASAAADSILVPSPVPPLQLRRISPQTSRPKGKQSSTDITCSYQQGRAGPTQRLGHLIKRVSPLPCANRLSVAEQQTQSRAWCCSFSTGKPSRTTGGTA